MDRPLMAIYLGLLVVITAVSGVSAYDRCNSYRYCENGFYCCGSYNTRCCSNSVLAVGAIIGIVIGSIIFLSCIITVICIVVKKQNARQGQVIRPTQPGVSVFATSQQTGYGQPMYGNVYGQQFGIQQQSGTGDPAYPPPVFPPPPSNY